MAHYALRIDWQRKDSEERPPASQCAIKKNMSKRPANRRVRWLNSTVLGIGLASLFSDLGHEMATTAMPALLASVGASSAMLGQIEGLADGLSSSAKLFSGLYSDRLRKRKPLAVAGYFVTACGMASFALATQWHHVLLGRVCGWIGRGARTPVRNVLLTEATTPETYGRAFGLERAMDSAGAVVGPSLALLLVAGLGLRWTFALTLIPGVIAALLIAFLVREKDHEPQPHISLWGGMKSLPREFRKYLEVASPGDADAVKIFPKLARQGFHPAPEADVRLRLVIFLAD